MPSYNERLTANNLKIDEITTLANSLPDADEINEKIDTQDTIIENLKSALDEKAGKTGGTPNIFLQDEEPTKKQGIWLKKSNAEFEKVVAEDSVVAEPTWLPDGSIANIPFNFAYGSAVTIGNDIYLFGGSTVKTAAYKYSVTTNTYTQLTNIPFNFYYGSAAVVGTNIYLFGSYDTSYRTYSYKYDTLTDTYTRLTNTPSSAYDSASIAIGTDIYLFGGNNGSTASNTAYKYDTLTDTYTQLTNIPYYFSSGSVAAIDTNVYLFGSGAGSGKQCYKYNTLTNTYVQLTDIPYSFADNSVVSIGNSIYLFGSSYNCYEYDTLSNTYTQMTNIPYPFNRGSAVAVNNNCYLFGGYNDKTKVQVLAFPSSEFDDKSIVLLNGSTYETQLFTSELVDSSVKYPFSDAWYYTEQGGLETDIPTYYGDGTQWVNIKNPINNGGGE